MQIKWQALEDSAGGLHLAIFNAQGDVEHLQHDYEYVRGYMSEDIAKLQDDHNPLEDGSWGSVSDNPQADYILMMQEPKGSQIVADNNGVYYERMGPAARHEFAKHSVVSYALSFAEGRKKG